MKQNYLTSEHVHKNVLDGNVSISDKKARHWRPTMLSKFQAMNKEKAHPMLPQSESESIPVEAFVHRGYTSALRSVVSHCPLYLDEKTH